MVLEVQNIKKLFETGLKGGGQEPQLCGSVLWAMRSMKSISSVALDNNHTPTTETLKSNPSLFYASQAGAPPGCWHSLKRALSPPLSCLINKSDVQFRNSAINLLKYCWRMLIVMPVAIKAHLHNLCAGEKKTKQLRGVFSEAALQILLRDTWSRGGHEEK